MLTHMRLALSGGWACSESQAKAQQKSCEQRRRSERRGAQRAELRGHWGRLPCPVGAPAWVGAPSSGRHAPGGRPVSEHVRGVCALLLSSCGTWHMGRGRQPTAQPHGQAKEGLCAHGAPPAGSSWSPSPWPRPAPPQCRAGVLQASLCCPGTHGTCARPLTFIPALVRPHRHCPIGPGAVVIPLRSRPWGSRSCPCCAVTCVRGAVCRVHGAACRVPGAMRVVPCAVRVLPCARSRVPCAVRVVPCARSRVPCLCLSSCPPASA